jgi:hypothetical protein
MIHRSCWLKSKKLCYSCVLKEANQSTPPSTTEAEQEEEPNKSKVVTAKATGGRRSTSYKKGSKDQIAPADVAEMIATENENGVVAGVAGGEKKTFQANTNPENPSSAVEGGGELVPDIQFGGTEANDTAASAVSHTPKSKTTTAAGNIEKQVPLVAPFSTMREKVSNKNGGASDGYCEFFEGRRYRQANGLITKHSTKFPKHIPSVLGNLFSKQDKVSSEKFIKYKYTETYIGVNPTESIPMPTEGANITSHKFNYDCTCHAYEVRSKIDASINVLKVQKALVWVVDEESIVIEDQIDEKAFQNMTTCIPKVLFLRDDESTTLIESIVTNSMISMPTINGNTILQLPPQPPMVLVQQTNQLTAASAIATIPSLSQSVSSTLPATATAIKISSSSTTTCATSSAASVAEEVNEETDKEREDSIVANNYGATNTDASAIDSQLSMTSSSQSVVSSNSLVPAIAVRAVEADLSSIHLSSSLPSSLCSTDKKIGISASSTANTSTAANLSVHGNGITVRALFTPNQNIDKSSNIAKTYDLTIDEEKEENLVVEEFLLSVDLPRCVIENQHKLYFELCLKSVHEIKNANPAEILICGETRIYNGFHYRNCNVLSSFKLDLARGKREFKEVIRDPVNPEIFRVKEKHIKLYGYESLGIVVVSFNYETQRV